MLIYGQKYHFKTLASACIDKVRLLSLKELKQHKEEIEPDNYLQIAEGIIQRLETQCKVKEGSLKCLDRVCESLYRHARAKLPRPATQNTTEGFLDCLVNNATDGFWDCLVSDVDKNSVGAVKVVNCKSLKCVADELIAQKKMLESLPSFQPKKGARINLSNLRIAGRSGIIWILIFLIPVAFTSMIHDSYKNFLPDSWFTKNSDECYLSLVLYSFSCCPHVCFHPVLCRFFDHCFYVVSFVLFRHGFCCNSTLSSSVTGETSGLSAPNARGAYCPRKKFENWTLGNAIPCIPWIVSSLKIIVDSVNLVLFKKKLQ